MRIEEYALVGDMESAALISTAGAVDWLCVPRFDSPSCFAALLGDTQHGGWQIAPANGARATARRYRPGTLVLETDFETDTGASPLTPAAAARSDPASPCAARRRSARRSAWPRPSSQRGRWRGARPPGAPVSGPRVSMRGSVVTALTLETGPPAHFHWTPADMLGFAA